MTAPSTRGRVLGALSVGVFIQCRGMGETAFSDTFRAALSLLSEEGFIFFSCFFGIPVLTHHFLPPDGTQRLIPATSLGKNQLW